MSFRASSPVLDKRRCKHLESLFHFGDLYHASAERMPMLCSILRVSLDFECRHDGIDTRIEFVSFVGKHQLRSGLVKRIQIARNRSPVSESERMPIRVTKRSEVRIHYTNDLHAEPDTE